MTADGVRLHPRRADPTCVVCWLDQEKWSPLRFAYYGPIGQARHSSAPRTLELGH